MNAVKGAIGEGVVVNVHRDKAFYSKKERRDMRKWVIVFDDGFQGENILPDDGSVPVFKEGRNHAYKVEYVNGNGYGVEIIPLQKDVGEVIKKFNELPNEFYFPSNSNRDSIIAIALESASRIQPRNGNVGQLLTDAEEISAWLERKLNGIPPAKKDDLPF